MIDRETVIEHSAEAFLRNQLFTVRQYPTEKVVMLDAYPTSERMLAPLDKNYIVIGWSNDDGGRDAELGSALRRRLYTFDFYVFGLSRVWGKNLASMIRFALESEAVINLIDPADDVSVIGHVDVEFVSTQQAISRNPRPWEENVWITRLRVRDYFSSAAGA